ncbi:MAG: sulfite exporter TauE/SafE family protein [Candidatus Sericytochromatia bacterium]
MKPFHTDLTSDALDDEQIGHEHADLGLPPVGTGMFARGEHLILPIAMWAVIVLLACTSIYLAGRLFLPNNFAGGLRAIVATFYDPMFWRAAAVGLLAQTIDGALGMAYGVTSTTVLLAAGASPAVASASVHIAEVFTTGISGFFHIKLGNVDKRLFLRLLLPGLLGAVTGAVVISSFDGNMLKPYISGYLLLMGIYIISKVFRKLTVRDQELRHVAKLAVFGGFVDAVGGGGWGPVVTSTLVGTGHDPRITIGSVNLAEFFLTFGSAIVFSVLVGSGPWPIVAGLVFGGLFAAPFAAFLCHKLHARTLLILVGTLISLLSLYNLYRALWA